MNVIIPVEDIEKDKSILAKGFHNTNYACIYNTLNGSYEWLSTNKISTSEDNLSLALKRKGIYTIITSHMPYLALRLFKESGLSVYKSKGKNLEENIDLFLKNELDTFSPQIQFKASSCSSSCSSCDTSCN
jgi:predicted Fe-Mo cluster-binding NifX family protein